ncbi:hypothetical protein [Sulfurimonas sp.]|uniref:hypothetical protein n=1 Tax=Sulfurimonas sp. TaxID=2022749 RepID=UPI003D0C42BB
MDMEIKNILTAGTFSLYFGESSYLTENEYEKTYFSAIQFVMLIVDKLLGNKVVLTCKKEVDFSNLEIDSVQNLEYEFSKKVFINNSNKIFKEIYFSENNEVLIKSDRLSLNLCIDPLDIQFYFGDERKKHNELNLTTKGFWKLFDS